MSVLMRVFCILMAFLLVCAFTTSIIGTEAPTLRNAMDIVSTVEIDTQRVVGVLGLTEHEVIPKYDITEGLEWYMKALYTFWNNIADLLNESFGAIFLIIGAFDVVLQVADAFLVFARAGFYLLFGVDWMSKPDVALG